VSRRAPLFAAFVLLFVLQAAPALAQSSGGSPDEQPPTAAGFFIGVGLLVIVLTAMPLGMRASRRRREAPPRLPRVRSPRVEAEAEAAGVSVHGVRAEAAEIFREVQGAWDARDEALLNDLVAPQVLGRWEASRGAREDFWAYPVKVDGRVEVEYVGSGTGATGAQQVLVRVQTQLEGWAPRGKPLPRKRWLR
jgi:hypothetical protein